LRVTPVKAILHKDEGVAKTRSADRGRAAELKVIRDDGNDNREIEVAIETPFEDEVSFVRKGGPRRSWNAPRRCWP